MIYTNLALTRSIGQAFTFMAILALSGNLVQAQDAKWEMVWNDEFDGEKLDFGKWEIEVNAFGGGNSELQMYTDRQENVRVADGNLVIEARKDNPNVLGTQREYSSGRIRSKNRGDWKYGRFEIRAKLAKSQGLWSAIWMMPTDNVYGTWPSSGEIDIMEFKGQEIEQVWGTLHYGGSWPNNKQKGTQHRLKSGNFCDDFHDFALEWEKGRIRWFVDGVMYQEQSEWSSEGGTFPAPFDQKFHLLLNLAVGGGFLGNPDSTSTFPGAMLIDYVRVFQKR